MNRNRVTSVLSIAASAWIALCGAAPVDRPPRPLPADIDPNARIAAKHRALGGDSGPLGRPLHEPLATPDGIGRYVSYEHGSIHWSPRTQAHATWGAIRDKWAALGWERGLLGYPMTDETATPDGRGRYNHFEGGSVYWHPSTGAWEVHGAIRDQWAEMGWERSALGYPISDELDLPSGLGRVSRFQRGRIEWNRGDQRVTAFDSDGHSIDGNRLIVRKLICHDTEDAGDDEARLVLTLDGRAGATWRRSLNEDDSHSRGESEMVINQSFRFRDRAQLKLWDEDSPDADDLLGVVDIGPESVRDGRAAFQLDGASYTLLYEVVGLASSSERPVDRAQRLLREFQGASTRSVFTNDALASRAALAASIAERLRNPNGLRQGQTSLCGPTSVVYELLRRRPDRYVEWVVELWTTGAMTVGGKRCTVSHGLRGSGIIGGMEPSDWILIASLRDVANVLFDIESGEALEGAAGMTFPWAMKDWIETFLGGWGTNMETSLVYGEVDDLELAGRYLEHGGVAFLNVNAGALDRGEGGNLPDHWVVLTSVPRIDRQSGRVEFAIWTWGREPKTYSLDEDQFEDAFYGAVVGMVPAPLVSDGVIQGAVLRSDR